MILDSGLRAMKKFNTALLSCIFACLLAAWLLVAGVLPATAEDIPQDKAAEKQSAPVKKQTPKKRTVKTPDTFVPTEKVSADRAVAFPTDI
jgi:hypothetical protein